MRKIKLLHVGQAGNHIYAASKRDAHRRLMCGCQLKSVATSTVAAAVAGASRTASIWDSSGRSSACVASWLAPRTPSAHPVNKRKATINSRDSLWIQRAKEAEIEWMNEWWDQWFNWTITISLKWNKALVSKRASTHQAVAGRRHHKLHEHVIN